MLGDNKMKKFAITVAIVALLVVSHFGAWSLGYVRGNVRMAGMSHKINLLLGLRAHHALSSNDLTRASEIVDLGIMRSSRSLDLLTRDPHRYFTQSLSWTLPSDDAFRPELDEGLSLTAETQSRWKSTRTSDGREVLFPPGD